VESNPTRMCELLVGLPAVTVLGIDDVEDGPIRVHLERSESRTGCPACGVVAESKGRRLVELVDLPVYGRSSRLLWHKRRFVCRDVDCENKTWTEVDERIAHPRLTLTDRAGRFATRAVGQDGRSVNEVARELGCDWHTVNGLFGFQWGAMVLRSDQSGLPA